MDQRDTLHSMFTCQPENSHRVAAGGRDDADDVAISAAPQSVGCRAWREHRVAALLRNVGRDRGQIATIGRDDDVGTACREGFVDARNLGGLSTIIFDDECKRPAEDAARIVCLGLAELIASLVHLGGQGVASRKAQRDSDPDGIVGRGWSAESGHQHEEDERQKAAHGKRSYLRIRPPPRTIRVGDPYLVQFQSQ